MEEAESSVVICAAKKATSNVTANVLHVPQVKSSVTSVAWKAIRNGIAANRQDAFRCGKVGHIAAACTNKVPLHKQGLPKSVARFVKVHAISMLNPEEWCEPEADFEYPESAEVGAFSAM